MNKGILKFGLLLLTIAVLGIGIQSEALAAAATSNGATLYAANCQVCHGIDGKGTSMGPDIQGVTATDIRQAIKSVPAMSGLKSLSGADLKAIASFLDSFAASGGGGK